MHISDKWSIRPLNYIRHIINVAFTMTALQLGSLTSARTTELGKQSLTCRLIHWRSEQYLASFIKFGILVTTAKVQYYKDVVTTSFYHTRESKRNSCIILTVDLHLKQASLYVIPWKVCVNWQTSTIIGRSINTLLKVFHAFLKPVHTKILLSCKASWHGTHSSAKSIDSIFRVSLFHQWKQRQHILP
jgi:hypothetical protein